MRKYLVLGSIAAVGAILVGKQKWRFRSYIPRRSHISETEASYRKARLRILILGAGFGGLATALELDRQFKYTHDVSVLAIDRDNDMLFTPLLWTAANGRTNPNNVVVPIRDFQKGRNFHVLHAEIKNIDLDHKEVVTSVGSRPYDILVIAPGSHTAIPDLPGLKQYATPFHTPSDAFYLRNRLIDTVEAAHQSTSLEERKQWLTFVIGGAGDTGVELAAIIHDYLLSGLFKEYPWLHDEIVRIILIGRPGRILPMGKPRTSQLAQKVLEEEGIEVLTGRSITGAKETTVETNKEIIPTRSLFWAAGITASDIVRQLPVEHAPNGAIKVDDHLRIPGYPEVYVIGDSSWAYDAITGEPVPATAQAARQQGRYVAQTIALEYRKRLAPSYQYKMLGHLALLGHYRGVAEIGPFMFDGFLAYLLWHIVYLWRIPSWSRRIRLVIDWFLAAVLGRETGQLRLSTKQPEAQRS